MLNALRGPDKSKGGGGDRGEGMRTRGKHRLSAKTAQKEGELEKKIVGFTESKERASGDSRKYTLLNRIFRRYPLYLGEKNCKVTARSDKSGREQIKEERGAQLPARIQ